MQSGRIILCVLLIFVIVSVSTADNERCRVSKECTRCSKKEREDPKSLCQETGHIQLVTCVDDTANTTRVLRESCTPDIEYTDDSAKFFVLFQVMCISIFTIATVFYIYRKRILLKEMHNRYTRLTSSSTTRE